MAWSEYACKPFREECNGMVHSPEQCYATAATPPAEPLTLLDVALSGPNARLVPVTEPTPWAGGRQVGAEELAEARLAASRFSYDVLMVKHWHSELAVVEESRLTVWHAALRWERVARRWAAKHGRWTMRDLAQHYQFWLDKMFAVHLKQLEESLHPMLLVPPEPTP